MHAIWDTIFYQPLYNALILITHVMPLADVGLAVIALTILVKLALLPITRRSIESQVRLKALEPEIAKIKVQYPAKDEQAKKTFELYKQYKVNPFSGCLLVIIQLPIIFALYYVFLQLQGSSVDSASLLYPFVTAPVELNTKFLGLIDVIHPNAILAVLAGVAQYIQLALMTKRTAAQKEETVEPSLKNDFMKSMNSQMKYTLPVFIVIIGFKISAAVALYWITSNVVTIIQEYAVRKKSNALLAVKPQ